MSLCKTYVICSSRHNSPSWKSQAVCVFAPPMCLCVHAYVPNMQVVSTNSNLRLLHERSCARLSSCRIRILTLSVHVRLGSSGSRHRPSRPVRSCGRLSSCHPIVPIVLILGVPVAQAAAGPNDSLHGLYEVGKVMFVLLVTVVTAEMWMLARFYTWEFCIITALSYFAVSLLAGVHMCGCGRVCMYLGRVGVTALSYFATMWACGVCVEVG